ncbi:MAG: type II toxin-antitoxin system VapC family toxin [Thermoplasmatota archaeon]
MKVTCPNCKRRIRIRRGDESTCVCKNKLHYSKFFKKKIPYIVYLIDANVIIYAYNTKDKRNKLCKKVLNFNSSSIRIGTTNVILDEIGQNKNIIIPERIKTYTVGKLSDELLYIKTNYLKQPSLADLSLVQAAIEHPEIRGIITYDKDFSRIATRGVIQKRSSSHFWLGNAYAFLNKYEIKSRVKKSP